MKRSERINKLVELEQVDEKVAVSQLGLSKGHLEQQQYALKSLLEYRQEYAERLSEQGQSGMEANRLSDFSRFMQQLDEAIEQQKVHLADAERAMLERQKTWQGHYQRVESLAKVVDQNIKEERTVRRKQVERQLDDRVGALAGNGLGPE